MRQIVLDTETTGLVASQGHRIIEIGAKELIDRRLTGNDFHYYCNPERDIDSEAQAVHGITREFLQDKPLFRDIHQEFISYINQAELIIHNATFDISFLDQELSLISQRIGKISNYCQIVDTLTLARKRHPGQKNSLDALCKRYHIDNSKRNLHGALLDAEILALVYLAMTGGQGNLFESGRRDGNLITGASPTAMTPHELNEFQTAGQYSRQEIPLKIITADVIELAAHEEYLQYLKQKSGNHWWQE